VKLERYGSRFLPVIVTYADKHGLVSKIQQKKPKRERKSKAVGRLSGTQQESLNLYKSGLTIAEIAHERGYSPMTIEGHLCSFVQSGELAVTELVDAHKIPAIEDAVQSYGAQRLAPLKEVLGEDYSYTEIKAVVSWLNRSE
jgi:ATP-dependent DNA helicase RecQ